MSIIIVVNEDLIVQVVAPMFSDEQDEILVEKVAKHLFLSLIILTKRLNCSTEAKNIRQTCCDLHVGGLLLISEIIPIHSSVQTSNVFQPFSSVHLERNFIFHLFN